MNKPAETSRRQPSLHTGPFSWEVSHFPLTQGRVWTPVFWFISRPRLYLRAARRLYRLPHGAAATATSQGAFSVSHACPQNGTDSFFPKTNS